MFEQRLDTPQPRHRDYLYNKCPQCYDGVLKLSLSEAGFVLDQLTCNLCSYSCGRQMSKKRYLDHSQQKS